MAQLVYKYQQDEDPRGLFDYVKTLERMIPEVLQKAAQTYLNTDNYVQLILFPEKKEKEMVYWILLQQPALVLQARKKENQTFRKTGNRFG